VADFGLIDLWAVLDVVILERLTGGFQQITGRPLPAWFASPFRIASETQTVTLPDVMPVLDAFLAEAEPFWDSAAEGRLTSEPFLFTVAPEDSIPVTAMAVSVEGRHFLLIQRDAGFDDRQRILQRGREQAFEHEQVVKRIQDLRGPVDDLASISQRLARTALGDEQRAMVSAVSRSVDALRRILDDLPKMSRGRR
jgi:hypothetical protein